MAPVSGGRPLASLSLQEERSVADVTHGKGGISGFFRNIPVFIQQVRAETAKVVWPTRRETVMTAVMVVLMTLLLSLFFFSVDWVFSRIVRFLLSLV